MKSILHAHTQLQALTCMFQETTTGSNLSRKGTLLMAEILQLANKVLPLSLAAKIQVGASSTALDDRPLNHNVLKSLSRRSSTLRQTTDAENTGSSVHPHCPPLTASIATVHGWKPVLLVTAQGLFIGASHHTPQG